MLSKRGSCAKDRELGWLVCALAALLVAFDAFGQSISSVNVSNKPGKEAQTAEFTLKITGKDFGPDESKILVKVSPKAELLSGPTVTKVSGGGTVVMAVFTAADDYVPATVTVEVGGSPSEPHVVSTAAGESDLKRNVKIYRSIIDPKDVSDIFGKRIAKRFLVVQVTVTNRSKDYQFLIHDISLDVSHVRGIKITKHYELSSAELSLLRGVAEKGQSDDPRNRALRVLRGAGNVAAGLIGVAHFGKSYAPAVAVWNGPVVSVFGDIFPDFTIGQMNRLNDSAYSANTIVAKQQAKVAAVFTPQAIFLNAAQRKQFWKDPATLFDSTSGPDLRELGVYVDGNFITNVEDLAPSVTSAGIDSAEMMNFQTDKPHVKGSISGKYLSGTDVKLLGSDLPGATARVDGTPTDQRLDFIVDSNLPIAPGRVLKIGLSKKGQDAVKETEIPIQYSCAMPTLTRVDPNSIQPGEKDKIVTLTGTNFLPGVTQVLCSDDCTVASVDVKSSTSLEAKVSVASTAVASSRDVTVVTPGGAANLASALKISK